jgi:hypothetical protein
VTDRFLVVLDSLAQAASDVRRTSDAVRDALVGALDDEVAVGHDVLQGVVGEFVERWQLGLDALLGGQHDIADRLDACVASYASTDSAAASAYVAAMTGPP